MLREARTLSVGQVAGLMSTTWLAAFATPHHPTAPASRALSIVDFDLVACTVLTATLDRTAV